MMPENQKTLQRVKQLEVMVYRGLHLNACNTNTDVIDQWIEQKTGSPAALEKLLNHIHMLDLFPDVQNESELEGFANEIACNWEEILIDCDRKYRVIKYEGYGPEVTFYYERGEVEPE